MTKVPYNPSNIGMNLTSAAEQQELEALNKLARGIDVDFATAVASRRPLN
jgi:hypothetical protein